MATNRMALYARSSNGVSAKKQIRKIHRAIGCRSILPELTYSDEGGGVPRPGLSQLLRDARAGLFTIVFVTELVRFGRRPVPVLALLKTWGVRIIAIDDRFDSDNPEDWNTLVSPFRKRFHDHAPSGDLLN